jgi:hypothetical protein
MLRRLFDHLAIIVRRFSDRGRNGFTGVIVTAVAWTAIIRRFFAAMRTAARQGNVHCGNPSVVFRPEAPGRSGRRLDIYVLVGVMRWIISSTLIQALACGSCAARAAARALFLATVAASAPWTSIISWASAALPSLSAIALSLPGRTASRFASTAGYDFFAAAASIASTAADAHPSATLRRYFSATLETHPALTTNSVRE